jgi:hypothetical protein
MVAEPQFLPSGSDVSVDRRGRLDPRVGKVAPADARSDASPSKDFGGLPPIEQGEGDSILAAFSRATDAVAAVLAAQRALLEEFGDFIRSRWECTPGKAASRSLELRRSVDYPDGSRPRLRSRWSDLALTHGG